MIGRGEQALRVPRVVAGADAVVDEHDGAIGDQRAILFATREARRAARAGANRISGS